ncbi:MAG: AlpA family phage regulatory protein [Xanthomonadales bacterium]|nr:AlpA family phage regulatory protein [Xanthomonadales bacterium]
MPSKRLQPAALATLPALAEFLAELPAVPDLAATAQHTESGPTLLAGDADAEGSASKRLQPSALAALPALAEFLADPLTELPASMPPDHTPCAARRCCSATGGACLSVAGGARHVARADSRRTQGNAEMIHDASAPLAQAHTGDPLAGFSPEIRDTVADLPPLVPLESVTKWAGYSTPGLYKAMGAGRFPRPVKLGPNRVAWLRTDLARWLAGRVAVRTAAAEVAAVRAGGAA